MECGNLPPHIQLPVTAPITLQADQPFDASCLRSRLNCLIVFLTFINGQTEMNQKVFRIRGVKLLIWPCGLFPLSRING